MLLLTVEYSNLKPSKDNWDAVAAILGGDLSPSAVRSVTVILRAPDHSFSTDVSNSQKYYKLKKDAIKFRNVNGVASLTPPATPVKRKLDFENGRITKHRTPTKRLKESVVKDETVDSLDGTQFQDFPSIQEHSDSSIYSGSQLSVMSEQYTSFNHEQLLPKPGDLASECFWLDNGHDQL